MKFFLLAGVAAATLMAQAAEAVTFSYSGSIVQWIVPTTGLFRITAAGAQGGFSDIGVPGGLGAILAGSFTLAAGQQIDIAVGGAGRNPFLQDRGGGGGGGSFVMSSGSALLIAGGGGGTQTRVGGNGSSGPYAEFMGWSNGTGGHGGASSGIVNAGGGAGLLSDGTSANFYYAGGSSFPSLAGGFGYYAAGNGGFGGGGAGGLWSGGGGGGFNGGGSGGFRSGGGGGGSFNAGTNHEALGLRQGSGSVSIEALSAPPSVPEPSVWSMLISGFGLVGFAMRRRVRAVLHGA